MEKLLDLSTKLSLDAWNQQVARFDKLIKELPDEQIQKEVAPGKNTGVYLLGHLAAVNDALLPLLGISARLQPAMEEIFLKSPDKSQHKKPTVAELKNYWQQVNNKLSEGIDKYDDDQWLDRHTSVSVEDFKNEPHRNKLNVLISRTNHLAYHFGQMALLKK